MKIALLAPIAEKVPPVAYGGTEAVVYNLAEELHKRGHDVTLFAAGDAEVSCKLVPIAPKSIGSKMDEATRDALTLSAIADAVMHLRQDGFDIVHNHTGWHALLLKSLLSCPIVTTLHGTLYDFREKRMFSEYRNSPLVSISKSQRKHAPRLRYTATAYHGLPVDNFRPSYQPGKYLVFLGRFSKAKGPKEAIEIAKANGMQLKMAGKVNDFERDYFEEEVKPLIDGQQITFIGEVNHQQKVKLLRGAKALLSSIHWDEPFGLVNLEAMLCGTPVIGMRRGSLPEIIVHGQTGFICRSKGEMIKAVGRLDSIDRKACRRHAETKFSVERMTRAYERVFTRLTTKPKRSKRILRRAWGGVRK